MHICTCNGYRTDLALKWTSVHRIHLYTCVYFKHIQIVSPKCDRVVVVWWVIFAFSVNLFWPRRLHRIVSRQGQSHMQDSFGCCRLSRRDIVTCTKPRSQEHWNGVERRIPSIQTSLIDVNWQRVSTPGNSVKHGVFLESISESAEMVTTKNDTWLCSTCPPCMLSYCLGLEPSLLCFARRKPYVCMAESVIQKLQVLALRSTNQRIVNFKVSLWFQACKFWAWAF